MAGCSSSRNGSIPANWSPMEPHETWKTVRLFKLNKEYENLVCTFLSTATKKSIEVISIERIQNPTLWERFLKNKFENSDKRETNVRSPPTWRRKKTTKSDKETNVRVDPAWRRKKMAEVGTQLLHGAKYEEIDTICEYNLDENISTARSKCKSFGKGFYLTSKTDFVFSYPEDPEKVAFICLVNMGKVGTNNDKMKLDSVVDCDSHPFTFIPEKDSIYPACLLTYREVPVETSNVQLIWDRVTDILKTESESDLITIMLKIMNLGSTEQQLNQLVAVVLSLQNQMNKMDDSKREKIETICQNITQLFQNTIGFEHLANQFQRVVNLYDEVLMENNQKYHTVETIRKYIKQVFSKDEKLKDFAIVTYDKFTSEFLQDLPVSGFVLKLQELGELVINIWMKNETSNREPISQLEDIFKSLAVGPDDIQCVPDSSVKKKK